VEFVFNEDVRLVKTRERLLYYSKKEERLGKWWNFLFFLMKMYVWLNLERGYCTTAKKKRGQVRQVVHLFVFFFFLCFFKERYKIRLIMGASLPGNEIMVLHKFS